MSIQKRIGTKLPENFTRSGAVRSDPGPFEAVVMSNVDPTRSGRLAVYVPDLGGDINNPHAWVTVAYASPFFGTTGRSTRVPSSTTSYTTSPHSYGFWFTPPDTGNIVLVTFVNGDPNRGYWFACVVPEMNHQMVPGISADTALKNAPAGTESAPVVEFNLADESVRSQWSDFTKIKKPIHNEQHRILLEQGLDRDSVRGLITSSSQRETPSSVFGLSTPGRGSLEKEQSTGMPKYRLGGHTLVLDDGDKEGSNQLIRLRTAGGHQIMMNDSEEVLYISNSTGTVWMEFTGEGQVLLYADSDISLRTKGTLNLHADKDINMYAGEKIQMVSATSITTQSDKIVTRGSSDLTLFGGKVGVASSGALSLSAGADGSFGAGGNLTYSAGKIKLNSGSAPRVAEPPAIQLTQFADAAMKGNKWEKVGGAVASVVTVLPHHEPYHSGGGDSE